MNEEASSTRSPGYAPVSRGEQRNGVIPLPRQRHVAELQRGDDLLPAYGRAAEPWTKAVVAGDERRSPRGRTRRDTVWSLALVGAGRNSQLEGDVERLGQGPGAADLDRRRFSPAKPM